VNGFDGWERRHSPEPETRPGSGREHEPRPRTENRETGEYESETTWHRCIAWGSRSEFAAALLKGALVQIEGEIRSREFNNGDAKRTVTEVRVVTISKLDRPAKADTADAKGAA
jgi:single-strand DNA-binding protein